MEGKASLLSVGEGAVSSCFKLQQQPKKLPVEKSSQDAEKEKSHSRDAVGQAKGKCTFR